MSKSDRAKPPAKGPKVEPKVPSRRAVGEAKPGAKVTKPKAVSRKSTAKAVKKTDTPKRAEKRGTPKGKGTVKRPNGSRIGNPPFKPTAEQRIRVEAMVTAGAQHWFIAEDLGIGERTLQRHFAPQLSNGKHRALSKIGGSMVGKALEGDVDASKFVLARIGGWKDRTAVEQSGPDGGPIVYSNEPPRRDLSGLSEEELEAYERLTSKLDARDHTGNE